MNLKNIQLIQNEIAIAWDDGTESYVPLERLRRHCPCAVCVGEQDILGKTYKGLSAPYKVESFQLVGFNAVGGYAVNFSWADGHHSGIYPFGLLKKLAEIT